MKKNTLLYMLLSITLFTLSSTKQPKNKLFETIDQLRATQEYCIEQQQKKQYIKALFGTEHAYKKELSNALEMIQSTIESLGFLSGCTNPEPLIYDSVLKQAELLIASHQEPPHIIRHWKKYAVAGIATLYALFKIHQKIKHEIIFIISDKSIGDALYGEIQHHRFHYTYDKKNPKQQYLRIEKQDYQQFKTLLQQYNITYQEHRPTFYDFKRMFYDRHGNNIIKDFFKSGLIEPAQHIKEILFKEHPNERMLVHDIEYGTKKFEEHLTILIKKALTVEETRPLIEQHIGITSLEKLSFSTKRTILQDILGYAHKHVPEKFESVQQTSGKTGSSIPYKDDITGIYGIITTLASIVRNDANFLSLTTQATLLHALERDLQLAILMNFIHDLLDKLRLNSEIIATIPVGLVSYGSYKGIKHLSTRKTKKQHKILYKELITFNLFLNKYRFNQDHTTLTMCKGMCAYWQEKISTFIPWIPLQKRTLFDAHIQALEATNNFEQKLTTVASLLQLLRD